MPRSEGQKLKLFYLRDFLLRNTDEEHTATVRDMIACLADNDIPAERKTIYADLELLEKYGLDIVQEHGKYYVGSRDFELPELKLLVDSVQASRFITGKKTQVLIKKLEKFASVYEAQQLNRQVFVTNRIKSMNESIYYNVDKIHLGIAQNRRIRFHYFEYNRAKERVFRKDGAFYEVSPYALTWNDENYYLIAFDAAADQIKHYRVDKMTDITVTDAEREGRDAFDSLDMGLYSRKVFGMFSGVERVVRLRMANHLIGAVLDRFGKDVMVIPDGPDYFTIQVSVEVSPQFFGRVSAFGADARILGPEDVVDQMRAHLRAVSAQYGEG
jgi:predicted DNA-binding transcriptional regulator YafY